MFTIDELSVINMYAKLPLNKNQLLSSLKEVQPFIEDADMQNLVSTLIGKIERTSQNELQELNLTTIFDEF